MPDDAPPVGAPPPEVPEEFAAAYTEAYRRALESEDPVGPEPDPLVAVEPVRGGAPAFPEALGRLRDSRWGLPALLAGVALLLVLAAYGIGSLVSGDDSPDATATRVSDGTGSPSGSPSRSGEPRPRRTHTSTPSTGAWQGPLRRVAASAVTATCTASPSFDAAGNRVGYEAENTLDGDASTAWRCQGTSIGERLTFELPSGTELGQVGLIPGYAKTDPHSGVDRYAENNRITRVRWTFGAGRSIEQSLDPDPENRHVQKLRVPRTAANRVTLEILEVTRGSRDTTAISEVVFAAAS